MIEHREHVLQVIWEEKIMLNLSLQNRKVKENRKEG